VARLVRHEEESDKGDGKRRFGGATHF
jgi:hypothetical protein